MWRSAKEEEDEGQGGEECVRKLWENFKTEYQLQLRVLNGII